MRQSEARVLVQLACRFRPVPALEVAGKQCVIRVKSGSD